MTFLQQQLRLYAVTDTRWLRPGEKLAFQYVTAAQAVAGARAQAAVLDKIRERMK